MRRLKGLRARLGRWIQERRKYNEIKWKILEGKPLGNISEEDFVNGLALALAHASKFNIPPQKFAESLAKTAKARGMKRMIDIDGAVLEAGKLLRDKMVKYTKGQIAAFLPAAYLMLSKTFRPEVRAGMALGLYTAFMLLRMKEAEVSKACDYIHDVRESLKEFYNR